MIVNDYFSVAEAAELIGVTTDTLYNWQKQNIVQIIPAVAGDQIAIPEIEEICRQLSDGTLDKLNKRANKKFSAGSSIPIALAGNPAIVEVINQLLKIGAIYSLPTEAILLGAAYNLLSNAGLVRFRSKDQQVISCLIKNKYLNEVINEWPNDYNRLDFKSALPQILDLEIPATRDFLGVLYQSLQVSGHKSKQGAYYTPVWLTDLMAKESISDDCKILDPCCGSGNFLLACAKYTAPEKLFGCDIDPLAVLIARVNLILMFPKQEFEPNIYCLNAFTGSEGIIPTDFDVVIGNPPWGFHFSAAEKDVLQDQYPDIQSGESFSYFIQFGLGCLKANGRLNYLLPESFLNTVRHKDIRGKLLKEYSIKYIRELGTVFDGVTSQVINLEAIKVHDTETMISLFNEKQEVSQVDAKQILDSADFIIAANQNEFDRQLMAKIYQIEHQTLRNQAKWALGIVTGNNQLFLSEEKKENFEPVITGKNIKPYIIENTNNFLLFQPKQLQQTAPEQFYRAEEKLIYRFISDRPILAYDNQQRLTLNSANIVIPHLENYSLQIIMALFNSKLYSYIYRKKFFSRKILRSHLEELPLPTLSDSQKDELLFYIHNYMQTEKPEYLQSIDQFVYKLFDLTDEEINSL